MTPNNLFRHAYNPAGHTVVFFGINKLPLPP